MAWVVGIGIFMFLLFTFPRQVVGLILLLSIVGGGLYAWEYFDQQERLRERQSVAVTAIYSTDSCTADYPIFVTIRNGSTQELTKVTFDISGNRPGYSDAIMDSGYKSYKSDKILAPGEEWTSCWTAPGFASDFPASQQTSVVPNMLEWRVSNIYPEFTQH